MISNEIVETPSDLIEETPGTETLKKTWTWLHGFILLWSQSEAKPKL